MQETSEKIYEAAKDHLLIAAHRGTAGGNIPCNTIQSYEAALLQGADIMEIDVSVSKDRKLFVFHPGMEPAHLHSSRYIKDMTADEVAQLRFVNQDGTPTECPVSTLDEIFDLFKNRCFINVDKFWTAIPEITDCIRRHGVQDQVIVKTSPKEEWFKQIEDYAPELPYMPIIQSNDKITDMLLKRKLNFIGAEVLFDKDDEETASDEYIEKMHNHGLLLWVKYNAVDPGGLCGFAADARDLFPQYIKNSIPTGIRGLMIVGVLAAALSSFNSAINSMASSFTADLYLPIKRDRGRAITSAEEQMASSKKMAALMGAVLTGFAIVTAVMQQASGLNLVDFATGVMCFSYAGMGGVFVCALFTRRGNTRSIVAALMIGLLVVLAMQPYVLGPLSEAWLGHRVSIAWTWWTPIGCLVSFVICYLGKPSKSSICAE